MRLKCLIVEYTFSRGYAKNPQYWHSFIETPQRLWRWSQHHPFESVGYGMVLLIVSLGAQYLITIAAAVAILGGIYKLFIQPLPK